MEEASTHIWEDLGSVQEFDQGSKLMHRLPTGSSEVNNAPVMQEPQESWVRSLGWEDALEEGMAIHTSILA